MGGMGNGMMNGPQQNCQNNGAQQNGQNRKSPMQQNGNCNGHNCQNLPQKMHNNNNMSQNHSHHQGNSNNSNNKNNSNNNMSSNQNIAKAFNQNLLCNYCNCKQMPPQLSQQFQMMNGQNQNGCNGNNNNGGNCNNNTNARNCNSNGGGQSNASNFLFETAFNNMAKQCFLGNNSNGNSNMNWNSNNSNRNQNNNGCNGVIGLPNGFLGSGNTHNLNFLNTPKGGSIPNSKQDQDMILASVDFNRLNGQKLGMGIDQSKLQQNCSQKFNGNNNMPNTQKDIKVDVNSNKNAGNGNGILSNKSANTNFNIDTFSPNGLFKTDDKSLKFGQNQWLNHALLSDPLNGFNGANMLYTDKFFNNEFNTIANNNNKKNGFLGQNGQQSNNNSNPDFSLLNLTNRFSAMNLNNPVNQFNLMNNIGKPSSTSAANNLLDNFASISNFDANEDAIGLAGAGFLNQQLFNFEGSKGKSSTMDNLDTDISLPGLSNKPSGRANYEGPSKSGGMDGFDLDEPQNSSSLNSSNLASFVRDNVVSQACENNSGSFLGSDKSKRQSSGSREKQQRRDRCETPEIVNSIQQQLLADDN